MTTTAEESVAAIVKLGRAPLPEGVRVVTRLGDIATIRASASVFADLERSESVSSVEESRGLRAPLEPEDLDLFSTPVSELEHRDTRRPPGVLATGRGVVVAVLDWGCDFAHPAFRRSDGSTRIIGLWAQRSDEAEGPENRWGYGRIFGPQAIDDALEHDDPYEALGYDPRTSDQYDDRRGAYKGTHGTHVLDIAAGSEVGAGLSGVAPDADLVFVHLGRTAPALGKGNLGDSVSLLEGLDFALRTAGARPCVVNFSVGAQGGPHDGSTLVEQGIDRAVSLAPGRAVVNSGGNYYANDAHAQGRVRSGEVDELRFEVPSDDPSRSEIELFYEHVDELEVTILGPSGRPLAHVGLGRDAPLRAETGETVGHVFHHRRHRTSESRHVDLFLEPGAPGGAWTMVLRGESIHDGRYHAWVEREAGPRPRFIGRHLSRSSTTGTLCNGKLSVTVGAYDAHDEDLALGRFSSAGPTRDGRVKPELVAPGVHVLAARSASPNERAGAGYTSKSGTSMAAPHVCGTIALMFEAAGRPLEVHETRAMLFGSTSPLDGPGHAFDRRGHGRLDIEKAENAARRRAKGRPTNPPLAFGPATGPSDSSSSEGREMMISKDEDEDTQTPYLPMSDDWREPIAPLSSPVVDSLELAGLRCLAQGGVRPEDSIRPGDLIRRVSPIGVPLVGVVRSGPLAARELLARGIHVERGGSGAYFEILEVSPDGAPRATTGRRLFDRFGRLRRGQALFRGESVLEAVDVDDVASEMNGLRCRFVTAYTASSGASTRIFSQGATLFVQDWRGTNPYLVVDGFAVPKVVVDPHFDRVRGLRLYTNDLVGQRSAIAQNSAQLDAWVAREQEYRRNRSLWEAEKARLQGLLDRRRVTYSRMWVRQMMYNRFDGSIARWANHYNVLLSPPAPLDPNVVKSILYQESRMGTSGRHLMMPPYDWNSGARHPIKSRFNLGQAIDSWGPQQWLMMREMAPSIATRHGLDALAREREWLGMSSRDYWSHATFRTALREFFTARSGAANLMGTGGRDLHEDYGFWIRTAIRWLFHKYSSRRRSTWAQAVRAYNGGGSGADRYRNDVMSRVGRTTPLPAESSTLREPSEGLENPEEGGAELEPAVERCGFFGRGAPIAKADLVERIRRIAVEESGRWFRRADSGSIVGAHDENDTEVFRYLCIYSLAHLFRGRETSPELYRQIKTALLGYEGLTASLDVAATARAISSAVGGTARVQRRIRGVLGQARNAARDSFPWSAVFITHCVRSAAIDLGIEWHDGTSTINTGKLLELASAHGQYGHAAIRRRRDGTRGTYHAFAPADAAIEVGDIIIQDRRQGLDPAGGCYQEGMGLADVRTLADMAAGTLNCTHGDIVTEVEANSVVAIGGNLSNGVRRRRYPTDDNGILQIGTTDQWLYRQESSSGTLGVPTTSDASTLRGLSTSRIFAVLKLVEECGLPMGMPIGAGRLV